MAFSLSRNERCYLQTQTAIATIPNTAGTATVANGDAARHTRIAIKNLPQVFRRNDKTGTRAQTIGIKGRDSGTWSWQSDLVSSGSAGVLGDLDPILVALFGQAGVIVTSTSVTYSRIDAIPNGFALWSFRAPAALAQRVAFGCLVQQAVFNFNEQGAATWSASGECIYVLDSKFFASATTAQKGGLTSFPVEPAAPATIGNIIAGFIGSVTIGGGASLSLKSARLTINRNDTLVKDNFNELIPTSGEGDEVDVRFEFALDDDDTSAMQTLKTAQFQGTAIDAVIVAGTAAGNIWTFTINDLQLEPFDYDDSQRRYRVNFAASRAYASSLAATDEIVLALT